MASFTSNALPPTRLLVALACAVQAALLLPLASVGEPVGDDLSIHLAEISQLTRSWAAGDLTGWNPTANLGFASGYYYQVLPQAIVALAALLLGWLVPLLALFKLAVALPLVLLPATTYRALTLAGMPRAPAIGAAFAVGIAFSTSRWGLGIDSVFTTGLYTQAWAMLLYPLALAHAWRYLRRGRHLGRAVVYPLLVGLCHPFVAISLIPALAVAPWWRVGARRLGGRAAVLGALVLAASAFFWLPILVHYDAFGGFARGASEAGLRPGAFAAMLWRGELLDAGRWPVLTALLVPAAALALHGRFVLAALLAQGAVFAALIMAGPALGAVGEADLLSAIRFLAPMQLALAAAAGAALVEMLDLARCRLAARLAGRRRAELWAWSPVAVTAVALAAALVPGVHGWSAERVRTLPVAERAVLTEVIRVLDEQPPGRFFAAQEYGTGSHFWMYLPTAYTGRPAVRAYGGAALQSSPNYVYLRGSDPARLARLYGVRYVLARPAPPHDPRDARHHRRPPPPGREVTGAGPVRVIEVGDGALFAPIDVIGAVPAGRGARREAVFAWLRSDDPDRGRHLVIGAAPASAGDARGPHRGRVIGERERLSRYDAEVDVTGDRPQTFVVRTSYHPGWRARVGGERVPVLRVTPDVMAVEVPPGRHRIELAFARPWWTRALLLASLALLAALGSSRRNRAPGSRSATRSE